MNGIAAALGRNRDTRLENQSHAGGVRGSRWRPLTTASRSRPKVPSSVVSEPRSFAKRSDSESKRTCGVRGRQDRVRGHRRKPESFEGKAHSTVVSVITEAGLGLRAVSRSQDASNPLPAIHGWHAPTMARGTYSSPDRASGEAYFVRPEGLLVVMVFDEQRSPAREISRDRSPKHSWICASGQESERWRCRSAHTKGTQRGL